MIYRGPGSLIVVWLAHPPLPPTPSFVSKLYRRRAGRLTKRETTCWREGSGEGWERSQTIRRHESLILYKSFKSLWPGLTSSIRGRILKLLRSPEIDAKESIPILIKSSQMSFCMTERIEKAIWAWQTKQYFLFENERKSVKFSLNFAYHPTSSFFFWYDLCLCYVITFCILFVGMPYFERSYSFTVLRRWYTFFGDDIFLSSFLQFSFFLQLFRLGFLFYFIHCVGGAVIELKCCDIFSDAKLPWISSGGGFDLAKSDCTHKVLGFIPALLRSTVGSGSRQMNHCLKKFFLNHEVSIFTSSSHGAASAFWP